MKRLDQLGERMKGYEKVCDFELLPNTWIVIRVDGRSFSNFTRKMQFKKPFDMTYLNAMRKTTAELVKSIQAHVGYTQSDEATFILSPKRERFSNRIQKLTSTIASEFSVRFFRNLQIGLEDEMLTAEGINSVHRMMKLRGDLLPHFDCRVYAVPSAIEAVNSLIWREQDAVKNSILSLAQSYFSHSEMQKLNTKELITKLEVEKGVRWDELDIELKRGCYLVPALEQREMEEEIWNKIPENKRPKDRLFFRSVVKSDKSFLRLSQIEDPISYLKLTNNV